MIGFKSTGSFKNTEDFLKRMTSGEVFSDLGKYGIMCVDALSNATPEDTGKTADSWRHEITHNRQKGEYGIHFYNNNVVNGKPIAILIQYGHGTRGGGYVQGRDYINPAIRPLFDKIANEVWEKVIK